MGIETQKNKIGRNRFSGSEYFAIPLNLANSGHKRGWIEHK